jgi:hypothetical protein
MKGNDEYNRRRELQTAIIIIVAKQVQGKRKTRKAELSNSCKDAPSYEDGWQQHNDELVAALLAQLSLRQSD